MREYMGMQAIRILFVSLCTGLSLHAAPNPAENIIQSLGVKGGLVVHLGCGDGKLTLSLRPNSRFQVHGLDTDMANVSRARAAVRKAGVYGPVSIDLLRGARLPYIDGMVNLLVSENLGGVPKAEVMRVLAPKGTAYLKEGGKWVKSVKPRPGDIDDWTHFLHGPGGNAVAQDKRVGPPRHLQWLGSPRWSRHHDRMASMSALVSANGRVFYVMDEGSRVSIQLPAKWTLVARDAFNGVVLWKKPMGKWHSHLWPLKSGPTQLARRLVAVGDRVYITLGVDSPVSVLDAATGKKVHDLAGSERAEEIIVEGDSVFALVSDEAWELKSFLPFHNVGDQARVRRDFAWNEKPRHVKAYDSATGKKFWERKTVVSPQSLTADVRNVFYHDGEKVVAVHRSSGDVEWQSKPVSRPKAVRFNFAPKLVVKDGVVLYAGGDRTMQAFESDTGKVMWEAPHARGGYQSPEDLLVMKGLVWSAPTTSGRDSGAFTGRDLKTGEVKVEFPPNVDTYWFHHRCYIAKGTENFLMPSRTGIEFVDPDKKDWDINHWVRGGCLYGVMPANGLTYAPPHNCACYPEAKLFGFNALAASIPSRAIGIIDEDARLVKGPAYGQATDAGGNGDADWPTYRQNNRRSGASTTVIRGELAPAWSTHLGGQLSAVTEAENKIYVSRIDSHEVVALHAGTGKVAWRFATGGRVDSPPSIRDGRAYFGCADGWVYCVRVSDGALAWRFRAAPEDRRLMAYEQLESVWPVHGSVLVENGAVFFVAGRSNFLDGGMRWFALDALTGKKQVEVVLDDKEPGEDKGLQERIQILQMPVGLPDILSSDEKFIYMKSQKFDREGKRIDLGPHTGDFAGQGSQQGGDTAHLFCPTGFLDGTWFHRTYWVYGRSFAGGHGGYYQAGKFAPSGRIMVFDQDRVYGFGRKPQYYKWTTILEHQLFATDRHRKPPPAPVKNAPRPKGAMVDFGKPVGLDPKGKALTVTAWAVSEKPTGIVLAHGGPLNGYALLVHKGQPVFMVRSKEKLAAVRGQAKITDKLVHLAGVLTKDNELRLYVNGQQVAKGKGPGLVAGTPAQGLQIGADDGSPVGLYKSPFSFKGLIDEAHVYHRALTAEEIASAFDNGKVDPAGLVLAATFDKGDAKDSSGKNHHGRFAGLKTVPTKLGLAMHFPGRNFGPGAGSVAIKHHWTEDLPILVRAMALAGGKLYLIGPPDLVDEETTFEKLTKGDPATQKLLAKQDAALNGAQGSLLLVVDPKTGKLIEKRQLESLPTWDSLAAALGKLYYTTTNGRVVCLGK